jgi:cyclase
MFASTSFSTHTQRSSPLTPLRGSVKGLRAFALILCLSFLPTLVHAEPGAVQKLGNGIYVWQGDPAKREIANCMWVIFNDYVVVIDANFPWGARDIIPKIKATTDKPIRYVLNTHYHGDHSYGDSVFTDLGAVIVSSEATDSENRTSTGFDTYNDAAHPLTGAHHVFAAITFSDRLVFDDGTQRIEMIRLGPAHSKGDSVAYLPKEKIVATGDLCVTWGIGNNVGDANNSYTGWLKALDTMIGWNLTTVVPGHGAVAGPEALESQKKFLAGMRDEVQAGIKAGKTADQLATELDMKKYGFIASDGPANASSIRNMYKHLTAGRP